MNKTTLKNFAVQARIELLERVELQARKMGITSASTQQAEVESSDAVFIDGHALTEGERKKRNKLISRINEIGFNRVMDEVAYTWFNRFTALRFMEVNDYLPTRVRVLSSENPNSIEPEMIKEALTLDFHLDKEYVYELKMDNKIDELFKYLLIMHCNDLNRYMPFMFEPIDDYSEILFPEGLLAKDSFMRKMTDADIIPEENWKNVEIIGWLYQYYISDENERVISAKKRYKAEEIPFATQLFTPEWIVKYMVQNALGRYWIESHPEHRDLTENWEYYLENVNSDGAFEESLTPYINQELRVEDIKCFDPAMGSGHILVYMFEILYEIYSKAGYMERDIPRLIIENNLYGLDIDDRAYQLSCFSVVMKATEYNNRFLRSIEKDGLTLNLASIQETNGFLEEDIAYLAGEDDGERFDEIKSFINQFENAKSIGSLLKIKHGDSEFLTRRVQEIKKNSLQDLFAHGLKEGTLGIIVGLLSQAKIMGQQYDVFITNPPYAGTRYLTPEVSSYLRKNYSDTRSDLFSAFIEYSFKATKPNGQMGFMTPYVWMFISSFEVLRQNILNNRNISSLIQLEYSGFDGATVPICTFTLRNYHCEMTGEYIRLSDFKGSENQPIKTVEAVQNPDVSYRYSVMQNNLNKIPGSPIAYWTSEKAISNFSAKQFRDIAEARAGMITGNNATFLRLWHEVSSTKIGFHHSSRESALESKRKWFPYNKGGGFRKWFGNYDYLVDWERDGYNLQNTKDANGKVPAHAFNFEYIFKKAITWSSITSSKFSARSCNGGSLFDAGGSFAKVDDNHDYILAYLNSKVGEFYLNLLNPTLNFQKGNIESLPIIEDDNIASIELIVDRNKKISEKDWHAFENSWGFKKHPLLNDPSTSIEAAFKSWEAHTELQFNELKHNEQRLNQLFIDIYGLQDHLTADVEEKDVTIRKADVEIDIKSFISYAIGCSFGRYSLDEEGLIYAGGEFNSSRYKSYKADEDNILPILPGAYFEDDLVTRFVDFIRLIFGEELLSKNLDFVADVLVRRGSETARETIRRYFMNDFYKDHVRIYRKRPIYWLFTSGKEKAFNCLIYMHRYDKSTLSRIRTDYLHEYQMRLDAEKQALTDVIESDGVMKEINDAKKKLRSLDKKIDELKAYDEVLHHMADMQIEIDLDDGVQVNYEKFKGLVAKI